MSEQSEFDPNNLPAVIIAEPRRLAAWLKACFIRHPEVSADGYRAVIGLHHSEWDLIIKALEALP